MSAYDGGRRNRRARTIVELLKSNDGLFYAVSVSSMLLFIPPDGLTFSGPSIIEVLVKALLVVSFFVMLTLYLAGLRQRRVQAIDAIAILIAVLVALLTLCTLLNQGDVLILGQKIIYIAGPWLYFVLFGRFGGKKLIKALFIAFAIVAVLNFVSFCIFYPLNSFRAEEGDYWLFGQRTYMRNLLLPALLFSALNDQIRGRRISLATIALMVTSPIVLGLARAATSLVTCLVLDVCIVLGALLKVKAASILRYFTIGSILADIAIVHARIINLFSFFIVGVLHKDLTLSKRTEVWDIVTKKISDSPLIGTGIQNLENSGITLNSSKQLSNAHNGLMDVCYKGGLPSLFALVALIALSIKPLFENKGNAAVRFLLGATIGCFFIEAIVSDVWYPQFFLLLYLSAYISRWEDDVPEEVKR